MLHSFHTLSILLSDHFLLSQILGTHIDHSNVTYQLQDCIDTDHGKNYLGLIRSIEPCLLQHSVNLWTFTVLPLMNFSALYKVEAQHTCFVGNNATELALMNSPAQFSGCLQHLEMLYWMGEIFYLIPNQVDDVSLLWVSTPLPLANIYLHLPMLVSIISQSDYLHRFLQYNHHQLNEHRLQTQIVAD